MTEARYDPPVARFAPDRELIAQAQRARMDFEDQGNPRVRFTRQRWEEAWGALHVAVDALREIWPAESELMSTATRERIDGALADSTSALLRLDQCAPFILGATLHKVMSGEIRTEEELSKWLERR